MIIMIKNLGGPLKVTNIVFGRCLSKKCQKPVSYYDLIECYGLKILYKNKVHCDILIKREQNLIRKKK